MNKTVIEVMSYMYSEYKDNIDTGDMRLIRSRIEDYESVFIVSILYKYNESVGCDRYIVISESSELAIEDLLIEIDAPLEYIHSVHCKELEDKM